MKTITLTEKQRERLEKDLLDVKEMTGNINCDIEIEFDYDDDDGINSPTIHIDGFVVDNGYWYEGMWIEIEHSGWYDYKITNYNEEFGYEDDVIFDEETTKILDYELANF